MNCVSASLNYRFQQHCRAMFVEQEKLWINTSFNRKLSQQARTEAVKVVITAPSSVAFVIQPKPSFNLPMRFAG